MSNRIQKLAAARKKRKQYQRMLEGTIGYQIRQIDPSYRFDYSMFESGELMRTIIESIPLNEDFLKQPKQ